MMNKEESIESATWVLWELCKICLTGEWDARVAASGAIQLATKSHFAENSHEIFQTIETQLIDLEKVDFDRMFMDASPLVSRANYGVGSCDASIEPVDRSSSSSSSIATLLHESDFVPTHPTARPTIRNLLKRKPEEGPSVAVSKKSKRQRVHNALKYSIQAGRECDMVFSENDFLKTISLNAVLGKVWTILSTNLLCDFWEVRHGAATVLIGIIKGVQTYIETIKVVLEDIIARCILVLGMDRFGDYSADSVVTPVRQASAQLLAIAASVMNNTDIISILCRMVTFVNPVVDNELVSSTFWGKRYASLVALKYLFVSEMDVFDKVVPVAWNILYKELSSHWDEEKYLDSPNFNDEVRKAASDFLLSTMKTRSFMKRFCDLVSMSPQAICSYLWVCVDNLNLVTNSSCVSMMKLVTEFSLLCHYSDDTVLKTLFVKIEHACKGFRVQSIKSLNLLLRCRFTWSHQYITRLLGAVLDPRNESQEQLFMETWTVVVSLVEVDQIKWIEVVSSCISSIHVVEDIASRALSPLIKVPGVFSPLCQYVESNSNQTIFMVLLISVLLVAEDAKSHFGFLKKLQEYEEKDWGDNSIGVIAIARKTVSVAISNLLQLCNNELESELNVGASNEKLVENAYVISQQLCPAWMERNPPSDDAIILSACQHVVVTGKALNAAVTATKLESAACFASIRVWCLAPSGEISSLVKPFINLFTVPSAQINPSILASAARCVLSLFERLVKQGKTKATAKIPLKLLQSVTLERTLEIFSAMSEIYAWVTDFLDTAFIRMEDPAPHRAMCILLRLLEHSKDHLTKYVSGVMQCAWMHPELVATSSLLVCAFANRSATETWEQIHRILIPCILNESTSENVRKACLDVISSLLEQIDLSLPFVAGALTSLMKSISLGGATCFSKLIELAPLESGVPDLENTSSFLTDLRRKGQEFLHGLLQGAEQDYFGGLSLATSQGIMLREYQKDAVKWLGFLAQHHLSGALCDDLGLGKTLMTLTQLASFAEKTPACRRSLVVCPSSLTGHWAKETSKWYGSGTKKILQPMESVGTPVQRLKVLGTCQAIEHVVVICSYSVLCRDLGQISALEWGYVVLDEAHTIRNPFSATARACFSVKSMHRLALTGTPVQNDVLDIW